MRIIMIGQKGLPTIYGGIERHVEELSIRLAAEGHEILAYVRNWYTPLPVDTFQGVRLLRAPTLHSKHLDAIVHTLTASIHALFQKPDIIHYHGVGPALLSFIPRLLTPKVKVVVTFHCIDRYHQKWGFLARFILKMGERAACLFPHQTIAVSKTIQNYCFNEYRETTTYIPNGVNTPDPTGTATLAEWGVKPNKYILMVSRLVRHKGAHYLIDAWRRFKQSFPDIASEYKLVIVGGSAFTDDYVAELRALAADHRDIIFTGWLSGTELHELYANTACLVHPSENEGLPLTVLQAMSYARPVLVSDIPEHQEIVRDRQFLFRNTDATSLAEKIVRLLTNPTLLQSAGTASQTLVNQEYHWDKISAVILEQYEQLLNQSPPPLTQLKTSKA